ncbi:MAG: hypothetical protein Q9184_006288 [Pyrenodesmia sp. 2 TL-2023]
MAIENRGRAAYRNSIPILPSTDPSLSTAWLDSTRRTTSANGRTVVIYHVPGTTTRLIIDVWGDELPELAMSGVILRTMNYAATHIKEKGDGALEPGDDPLWLDTKAGVIFGLWSTDAQRHLTYRDLQNTAKGLWTALYLKQKYNAAAVTVYDLAYTGGRNRVGYGVLRAGPLRVPISDS